MCFIGVHPEERDQPQRVKVSIELKVNSEGVKVGELSASDAKSDEQNLGSADDAYGPNVIDYEKIVQAVRRLASTGHINLCEDLAQQICQDCLIDGRVERVYVSVEKLDVYADAESAGVIIECERSN